MPLGRANACARSSAHAPGRGWIVFVYLLLAAAASCAWADSRSDADAVARRVARAWGGENAAGITGTMRPGGRVRLDLLLLERSGAYQRSQAERLLRAYFRKLSRVRLKDVTPRKRQASDTYRVSTFEYAYKPEGRDPVTSLLVITLKASGSDRWYLEGVQERRKRRARR